MPLLIENIIATVVLLLIVGLTLTAGFALVTVQRRLTRQRYFQALDRARLRAQEVVEPLYAGEADVEMALASFRTFRSRVERRALEEKLLWHTKIPEQLAITRQVVAELGWINEWVGILRSRAGKPTGTLARVLAEMGDQYRPPKGRERLRVWLGANFLARCLAAERLTQVPTREGLLALLAATEDRHADVEEVCIRNLGRLADPATLPVLMAELIDVLEGRGRQSVRNLKTALSNFPLDEIDAFRDALQHSNRRVRFFATDIIRQIADRRSASELLSKNDFSPEMYRMFTERLCEDDWGDVRARAALVIGHFRDTRSNALLQKLMQDEAWFVRLHACRAASGKFFIAIAPAVAQRLADPHWLVREAAVRALRGMGEYGVEQIYRVFMTSEDPYSADQISEEIQRSGMLAELLANVDTEERRRQAMIVIRRMVGLNKITMLLAFLMSPVQPDLKLLLIRELSACVAPECLDTLRRCSEEDPDMRVRTGAFAAFQSGIASAASAEGA